MRTPPSAEFTTAANSSRRLPKMKVDLLLTDPFVQSGTVVASTHLNNFCGLLSSEVEDDLLLHVADTILETPHKYVINDGTLINDGTFYPIPSTTDAAANSQVGWHTSGISDSSGDFATAQELTVTFISDRTIKQVIVVGEPTLGEYPTDFDVEIYDSGDSLLNTTTNFSGSSVETQLDFTNDNITTAKYMILKLNSWSEPGTIGKIVEFFGVLTETLYGDDLISMDVLEEFESSPGEAPFGGMSCNELNISLQNVRITKDGSEIEDPYLPENTNSYLRNSITKNVRATPYMGFELPDTSQEFVKMGVFWVIDWDISQTNFPANILARDRMELLIHNTFLADEILVNVTLKDVAEYVLNHAKVNIPLNDLEWSIDSDLDNYSVTNVWMGKVTYFEALNEVVSACLGRAYCDRDGVIIIESYLADSLSGSADFSITSNFFPPQRRRMQKIKNYVTVPVCKLIPEVDDEDEELKSDVYSSNAVDVGAGDTTIIENISWEDDGVLSHEVEITEQSGISVVVIDSNTTYYPWGAEIVFEKTSGTSGTFKYKVLGVKLVAVQNEEPAIDYDDESIRVNNKQEFTAKENYLIQSYSVASIIASAILKTLVNEWSGVSEEIQGNPCTEVGDICNIEIYSKLSKSFEYRVERQQFKMSRERGLRCRITGRKTIDHEGGSS